MLPTAQHVIFGAGAVGATLAEQLATQDTGRIRLISRSGADTAFPAGVPDNVDIVRGDASDPAFATHAAARATVVYQILNPAYHRWAQDFPPLQASVLTAAEAAGARLVSLDNVYGYGRAHGEPLIEQSPVRPNTRKGRVRAQMAADLLAAHHAGRVEVVIARAADYYGPRGGGQSNLGDRVVPAALAGKTANVLGDPDQPHTYSYLPDIAAGLAALGAHPSATGRVWHLPNDPQPMSTRQLVELLYAQAGSATPTIRSAPWTMLRIAGLFNRTLRELPEMRYEYDEPFLVDSSMIADELGLRATSYADGLSATLAYQRTHWHPHP